MDSGKALARSGEVLIDLTTSLNIYGGSLSAMGANVRNCGDCLAQAAASCRFKTGVELVIDELREGEKCCGVDCSLEHSLSHSLTHSFPFILQN